jgi:PAS domain S-box-containing protein
MELSFSLDFNSVFFRCVEDCSEPIMISDRTGRLKYVNPSWCATYGYSKEEAIGDTPRLLRSQHQSDEFYRDMWRQILDPTIAVWKGEVVNRAKDGRFVTVFLTITPYKSGQEIVGYMAIAVDLSERRSMERQILRQDRLASIGMLASGLAHEIGNPLGVIRGRAEIIMNTLRSGISSRAAIDSATQGLDTILSQIDRISRLIESLLKISRVPQEIRLTNVSLAPIAQEVETLMAENIRRNGIKLENRLLAKELANKGKSTESTFGVLADAQHLQQILLNLLINGVHAIEEERKRSGRVDHTLAIDAIQGSDGYTTLIVEDTGCGLSEEVKRRMFEPFFTTKTPGQGTGLGLAIVTRLVEEMQGKIVAESAGPGLGSKVQVQLKSSSPASAESAVTNP